MPEPIISAVPDDDRMGRVQSLVRAFGLLDLLARHDGLSLTEIARLIDLPRSTVHRLLTTMGSLNYVRFEAATNRWAIGAQAFTVGSAFAQTRDLGRLGRPIMHSLMLDTRETVNMSIVDDEGICYVGQVRPATSGRSSVRPGVHLPIHASAAGKAMMAHWDVRELDLFLDNAPLIRHTARTLTDAGRLRQNLEIIRHAGFAVDDEEHETGTRCIAAPVFDSRGLVRASLSISAPAERLRDDCLAGLGATLAHAASRMSKDVGAALAA